MKKPIGNKIRQIRELKGYSQEYIAEKLGVSQRAYSKLETNETKLDWQKITKIAEILNVEPTDIVNFDDNLIFNNCNQSGKFEQFINQLPERLIDRYEKHIQILEDELIFLREELRKRV
jgi:transcriptional regulator with XRE-family HTH domain